jgi:hypothetical protein
MKPLFVMSDRPEAAETFVNVLIDNDFDPRDLKKAFKKDGNIINALGLHDDVSDVEEEDDEEDGYEDYDDDEDDDY